MLLDDVSSGVDIHICIRSCQRSCCLCLVWWDNTAFSSLTEVCIVVDFTAAAAAAAATQADDDDDDDDVYCCLGRHALCDITLCCQRFLCCNLVSILWCYWWRWPQRRCMVLVVASNGLFAALSTSCLLSFLLTVVHFPFFLKFMLHLFLYNCCCCWQNFYGDIDDKWNCECFLRFYASASLIDGVGGIVFWSCPSIGVYVCARMLGRRHSPTVLLSTSCLCLFCDVSSAISLMLWITVGAITAGLHCHSKNRDRIWQFFNETKVIQKLCVKLLPQWNLAGEERRWVGTSLGWDVSDWVDFWQIDSCAVRLRIDDTGNWCRDMMVMRMIGWENIWVMKWKV